MNRTSRVIEQVKFAVAVGTETDDSVRRVSEFPMIDHLAVRVTESPKLAGVIVRVDVCTMLFVQTATVIRQTVSDRGGL